jgi:2,4-diketo-3-deoxy-L-fuconate hydrolase
MKLFRYGPPGHEKPALIDKGGHWRDLSSYVPDIGAATLLPESLAKLRP